jgi:undecaprenyl-diphosphatase
MMLAVAAAEPGALEPASHAMSWLDAAILGLVEGITEFLPVSSTGHLIITSALLGLDKPPEQKAAVDAFLIGMQGGAILAVLGLYWPRVLHMIRGLVGRNAAGLKLFTNLVIAFLPAAILGVLLDDWIESKLFHPVPVIAALALGGIAMILLGPWQRRFFHEAQADGRADAHALTDIEHLSWKRALVIGLLQCVAMWPGTSRSMMTIVGGMLVGMRPKHAAEFSFLLGLPTLGGACLYKGAKNLMGDGPTMFDVLDPFALVVGLLVAMLSAAIAIKWLVGYLSRHGVAVFGWYRLALCALLGALIYFEDVSFAPTGSKSSSSIPLAPALAD